MNSYTQTQLKELKVLIDIIEANKKFGEENFEYAKMTLLKHPENYSMIKSLVESVRIIN